MNVFNTPLTELSGIGEKRKQDFEAIGIYNLYDLLMRFPVRYQDRSTFADIAEVQPGQEVCINCTVKTSVMTRYVKRNLILSNCIVEDESGEIMVVWYNQKYVGSNVHAGKEYVFFGKVEKTGNRLELRNPAYEKKENAGRFTGKIIPVYFLGKKIAPKTFQNAVEQALHYADQMLPDVLPQSVRARYGLWTSQEAIRQMHFPDGEEQAGKARERFVFEEFFLYQAGIAKMRAGAKKKGLVFSDLDYQTFCSSLPFSMTQAQKKVIREIAADFKSGYAMNRLVQGDVGSGKTAVAAAAIDLAVRNGYQAAMMAPTEILAKQHEINFRRFFPERRCALLTSSVAKKEKQALLEALQQGEIDILIGTHALIQEPVTFARLGLVITDEQHRFGVNQRKNLMQKGNNPHVLVLTATPIPRTLAIILYGDLDISVIDQLPPGRQQIRTFCINELYRDRVYRFVEKKVAEGQQAYVVCPLVEEAENLQLKDVTSFAQELQTKLDGLTVGLLHGRMKEQEKNLVMSRFQAGEIQILVSTTVIEVGVDVPNATVMVIENAERFGLSQLHQLRGRVGRGSQQSFCILFANTKNPDTLQRLKVIETSSDGFYISEQDLKLRGPGDFFGTRQHGLPVLKTANPTEDTKTLYQAKEALSQVLSHELPITEQEGKLLQVMIKKMFFDENYGQILN